MVILEIGHGYKVRIEMDTEGSRAGIVETGGGAFVGRDLVSVNPDKATRADIWERLNNLCTEVGKINDKLDREFHGNGDAGLFERVNIIEHALPRIWVLLALMAFVEIFPHVLDFISWLGRLAP